MSPQYLNLFTHISSLCLSQTNIAIQCKGRCFSFDSCNLVAIVANMPRDNEEAKNWVFHQAVFRKGRHMLTPLGEIHIVNFAVERQSEKLSLPITSKSGPTTHVESYQCIPFEQ